MLRPSRRLTAAAGFAVILAMATPALANAQPVATHQSTMSITAAQAFPSATSTVIGSVGFIDSEQVGYFWSASRGDSVAQTFSGPASIKRAILKLDVTSNNLASGATVDWTLSVNSKDVGSFQISAGQSGPVAAKFKFAKISGASYSVKLRETNEVAPGDGSIALRYAGSGPHSITLKKK